MAKTKTSFIKGNEISGRPKGVKNKVTKEVKEIIKDTINNQIPKVNKALDDMFLSDPAKAIELTMKLMEYVVPKLKAIEHSASEGNNVKIKFSFTGDRD